MSLRSKHQRAARLQRLHQTALRLISTHGIYGWRLHQLAKELNYTTAALYRYYPSKELLLEALQKKSLADMRSSLSKLIAQSNLTPLGTVLLCTEFYVCYARCSPTSFSLNSNILAHPTAILQGEGRKTLIDLMKELLKPPLRENNKFYNKIHTTSKRSELKRITEWLKDFRGRDKDFWLVKLVKDSGIYQGYINKERRLLLELGNTNHPYPEEEL